MSATEHQITMWMVYWAAAAGALFSLVAAVYLAKDARDNSVAFAAGLGGGPTGGATTALFGFILGLIVKPYDVPGQPGLYQAFGMALEGLVMGLFIGLAVGLVVGGLVAASGTK